MATPAPVATQIVPTKASTSTPSPAPDIPTTAPAPEVSQVTTTEDTSRPRERRRRMKEAHSYDNEDVVHTEISDEGGTPFKDVHGSTIPETESETETKPEKRYHYTQPTYIQHDIFSIKLDEAISRNKSDFTIDDLEESLGVTTSWEHAMVASRFMNQNAFNAAQQLGTIDSTTESALITQLGATTESQKRIIQFQLTKRQETLNFLSEFESTYKDNVNITESEVITQMDLTSEQEIDYVSNTLWNRKAFHASQSLTSIDSTTEETLINELGATSESQKEAIRFQIQQRKDTIEMNQKAFDAAQKLDTVDSTTVETLINELGVTDESQKSIIRFQIERRKDTIDFLSKFESMFNNNENITESEVSDRMGFNKTTPGDNPQWKTDYIKHKFFNRKAFNALQKLDTLDDRTLSILVKELNATGSKEKIKVITYQLDQRKKFLEQKKVNSRIFEAVVSGETDRDSFGKNNADFFDQAQEWITKQKDNFNTSYRDTWEALSLTEDEIKHGSVMDDRTINIIQSRYYGPNQAVRNAIDLAVRNWKYRRDWSNLWMDYNVKNSTRGENSKKTKASKVAYDNFMRDGNESSQAYENKMRGIYEATKSEDGESMEYYFDFDSVVTEEYRAAITTGFHKWFDEFGKGQRHDQRGSKGWRKFTHKLARALDFIPGAGMLQTDMFEKFITDGPQNAKDAWDNTDTAVLKPVNWLLSWVHTGTGAAGFDKLQKLMDETGAQDYLDNNLTDTDKGLLKFANPVTLVGTALYYTPPAQIMIQGATAIDAISEQFGGNTAGAKNKVNKALGELGSKSIQDTYKEGVETGWRPAEELQMVADAVFLDAAFKASGRAVETGKDRFSGWREGKGRPTEGPARNLDDLLQNGWRVNEDGTFRNDELGIESQAETPIVKYPKVPVDYPVLDPIENPPIVDAIAEESLRREQGPVGLEEAEEVFNEPRDDPVVRDVTDEPVRFVDEPVEVADDLSLREKERTELETKISRLEDELNELKKQYEKWDDGNEDIQITRKHVRAKGAKIRELQKNYDKNHSKKTINHNEFGEKLRKEMLVKEEELTGLREELEKRVWEESQNLFDDNGPWYDPEYKTLYQYEQGVETRPDEGWYPGKDSGEVERGMIEETKRNMEEEMKEEKEGYYESRENDDIGEEMKEEEEGYYENEENGGNEEENYEMEEEKEEENMEHLREVEPYNETHGLYEMGSNRIQDHTAQNSHFFSRLAYKNHASRLKYGSKRGFDYRQEYSNTRRAVWENPRTGELWVSFRGTNPYTTLPIDLASDLHIMVPPSEMSSRFMIEKEFVEQLIEENPDVKIHLGGHSLGSSISLYVNQALRDMEQIKTTTAWNPGQSHSGNWLRQVLENPDIDANYSRRTKIFAQRGDPVSMGVPQLLNHGLEITNPVYGAMYVYDNLDGEYGIRNAYPAHKLETYRMGLPLERLYKEMSTDKGYADIKADLNEDMRLIGRKTEMMGDLFKRSRPASTTKKDRYTAQQFFDSEFDNFYRNEEFDNERDYSTGIPYDEGDYYDEDDKEGSDTYYEDEEMDYYEGDQNLGYQNGGHIQHPFIQHPPRDFASCPPGYYRNEFTNQCVMSNEVFVSA